MVPLPELLRRAGLDGGDYGPLPITGIAYDSRGVEPGFLFVAVSGFHVDGHDFASAAVTAGAAAVVSQRPLQLPVPVIVVPDTRRALSFLAGAWYEFPSRRLTVAGVTGTDGKTTTTTMLWSAWQAAGYRTASMSTVDWRLGDEIAPNKLRQTTIESLEIQERLRQIGDAGCTHCALETSSHALHLGRVEAVEYRAAAYTKVTSEHLELHGSREAYLDAKAHLLDLLHPDGIAVFDLDDAWATPVLQRRCQAHFLTYSAGGRPDADLRAAAVEVQPQGTSFTAETPWGVTPIRLQLAGSFNVGNALAAVACACGGGVKLDDAVRGIESLERVPGRMERVNAGQPFSVVIDYAHTAEALAKVLAELRPATPGRLFAVFGSAGERDREKRPAMGRVAAELADIAVITDEDPRQEDRLRILEEIAAGARAAGAESGRNVYVIPDRNEAVGFAVAQARPGDTILCAGKGHETSMFTAAGAIPWDERKAVLDALQLAGYTFTPRP